MQQEEAPPEQFEQPDVPEEEKQPEDHSDQSLIGIGVTPGGEDAPELQHKEVA